MGSPLRALCNHNIPLDSTDKTCATLRDIFKTNVYLIFTSYIDLSKEMPKTNLTRNNNPFSYETKSLYLIDKWLLRGSKSHLYIEFDDYLYEWFYKKYGKNAGKHPDFMKHWTSNPKENNRIIKSFMKDSKIYRALSTTDDCDFDLLVGSAIISNKFAPYDWFFFIYTLLDPKYHFRNENYEKYYQYILTNRELAKKLGGNRIYYLDTKEDSLGGIGAGEEFDLSWKKIESNLRKYVGKENIISLNKYFENEDYRQSIIDSIHKEPYKFSVMVDDF